MFTVFVLAARCDELLKSAVIFRHGARYPMHSEYDGNMTRQDWGELSPTGMAMLERLGIHLKKKYMQENQLLSQQLDETMLEAFSTNYSRTKASIISLLYGLYPLGKGPKIYQSVAPELWVPPYQGFNISSDNSQYSLEKGLALFNIQDGTKYFKNCKRQNELVQASRKSFESTIQQLNKNYTFFFNKVGSKCNQTITDIFKAATLYDTLISDIFLGRQIPISDEQQKQLKKVQLLANLVSYSQKVSRILVGPLYLKLLNDLASQSDQHNIKLHLYAAHQESIIPFLVFNNLTSLDCVLGIKTQVNCVEGPKFASSITFQVWRNWRGIRYVKIAYDGKYMQINQESIQFQMMLTVQDWQKRTKNYLLPFSECEGDLELSDL